MASRRKNRKAAINSTKPTRRLRCHRRILIEQLEDRRMLSIGDYPELPGMVLVDPRPDQFEGQVVFLDFDGADDVTYNGPVVVEGIDVPAFEGPGELAGQEPEVIASIVTELETVFAGAGISFTTQQPGAGTEYSAIYIGGDDSAFREYGSFLGLAQHVDVGNSDRQDDAFVFVGRISPSSRFSQDVSYFVCHEIGHLLGYEHQDADHSVHAESQGLAEVAAYQLSEYWGHEYATDEEAGIRFVDVDKSDLTSDDDELCWAASAANILQWTGWGTQAGFNSEEELFQYFVDHARNTRTSTRNALDWWFNGLDDEGVFDNPGGNLYPNAWDLTFREIWATDAVYGGDDPFGEPYYIFSNNTEVISTIRKGLESGFAVSVGLAHHWSGLGYGSAHVLTIWGYSHNDVTNEYAFWYTDSDHGNDDISAFNVNRVGNMWLINGAQYDASNHIVSATTLEQYDRDLAGGTETFADARTIEITSDAGQHRGRLDTYDDADYFRFIASNSGTTTITVDPLMNELDPGFGVYDSNHNPVGSAYNAGNEGQTESLEVQLTQGQTYFIKVNSGNYSTYGEVEGNVYTISITLTTQMHTITASSGPHGEIVDASGNVITSVEVAHGDSITFYTDPDQGYVADKWYIDGEHRPEYDGLASVTGPVERSGSIYVKFKPEIDPGITVTSPSGGVYTFFSRVHAAWQSIQITGDVEIELYQGTTLISSLEDDVPVADGSDSVRLPGEDHVDEGTNYRLKVTSLNNSSIFDYSDYFEIRDIDDNGDPINIDSEDDLRLIGSGAIHEGREYTKFADYLLVSDIDFHSSGPLFEPLCQSTSFSGTFDGQGHTIEDLWIEKPTESRVGLFSRVSSGGVIKNLFLEEAYVIGGDTVGAVAGKMDGLIANVHVDGDVRGTDAGGAFIGGLVGQNQGTIRNSSLDGTGDRDADVEGWGEGVGGIVGWNDGGTIAWSYVIDGRIDGREDGQDVGGIAGDNYGIIRESYWVALDRGEVDGDNATGGIVGYHGNGGQVLDSYAVGEVDGYYDDLGGVAGETRPGSLIERTYAIGPVDRDGGRLVGSHTGNMEKSFWDSSISGPSGVVESGGGAVDDCVGLPTSQMRQQATFEAAGWDFDNVWTIDEGNSYPTLRHAKPSLTTSPTGVAATDGEPSKVTVSWNSVTGASTYGVYRTETLGATPVLLGYSPTSTLR